MVMDRLTKRIDGRLVFPSELIGVMMTPSNDTMCRILTRLAAYEDTGVEPEQVLELKSFTQGGIHKIEDGWKHVQELLQAEQDGRLVVLPCKAGTLIYIGIRPAIITQFFGYVRERYFHAVFCDENKGIDIPFEELGKTVFLTREEAEAALKGGEG